MKYNLYVSSASVIVHAGGTSWLNPFAKVFNVCSTVTIECCVLNLYCVGELGILAVM